MTIEELKKDFLWQEYNILPNMTYAIKTKNSYMFGKVLNFDSTQFVLNTLDGFRIIRRSEIHEMKLANILEEDFIKRQVERLIDIGFIERVDERT